MLFTNGLTPSCDPIVLLVKDSVMHQPLSGPLSLLMVIGDGDCRNSTSGVIYPSDECDLMVL